MAKNFIDWVADSAKGAAEDFSNAGDALVEGLKETAPSFEKAIKEAENGKAAPLAIKVTGVAIGSYVAAHGINNLVRGTLEKVEHPAHDGREVTNTTRLFWGGTEALTGLSTLYFALTRNSFKNM